MKGYTNSVNINSKKNKKNFIYIHIDIVLSPKFDIVIDLSNVYKKNIKNSWVPADIRGYLNTRELPV